MLNQYAKYFGRIAAILGGAVIFLVGLGVTFFKSAFLGLLICLLAGAFVWWIVSQERKEYRGYIADMNRETGCNFTEAFGSGTTSICIDENARKLALLQHSGVKHHLFGFEEIDDWELRWTEVSRNGTLSFRDVHFAFRTTRIDMPIFKVGVSTKMNGEAWSQKLRLLMS
ncbi:hypothetical protein [Cupriavidus necator]|nr:hypothetical protein [Cupriavidus necator]MDX6014720.1 hypothetical protein [Cupriavidus necator]